MDAAAEILGQAPRLTGFEAIKFPVPLRPGGSVTLAVAFSDDGRIVRFRVFDGERVFATGRALIAGTVDRGDPT